MQFAENRKRRQNRFGIKTDFKSDSSSTLLNFYRVPPTEEISLQEFEELAVERLKVLRVFEQVGLKHNRASKEYGQVIKDELTKHKLRGYIERLTAEKSVKSDENCRRDHISHFILKLAYCRSEDLRRWFLNQEMDLFRYRFEQETSNTIQKFMEDNNLSYKPLTPDEREDVIQEVVNSLPRHSVKADLKGIYKVPFLEVLDLVRQRKVYLHLGFAYVTSDDLISCVLTAYRNQLSHSLAVCARYLPQLEEDDRIIPILKGLNQRYVGRDYSNTSSSEGNVTPDMIDSLSQIAFPLCMRSLHEGLRQNHHLRHGGRLQYSLFLKGIGLTLEDSLRVWREEFTKIMDVDAFDKKYSYNVRHTYGKEGRKTSYTPYSCSKIIQHNPPGPGDLHGCPFKHCDEGVLKQKLKAIGIKDFVINEISELVRKGHYQLACTKVFEVTHGVSEINQAIGHPNEYFENSQKLRNAKTEEKGSVKVTTTRSVMYSQQSQPSSSEFDYLDEGFTQEDIESL